MGLKLIKTISYSENGKIHEIIPNNGINKIILSFNGTPTVTGGTLIDNTMIKEIGLKIGVADRIMKTEDWSGKLLDGKVPMGITFLREYNHLLTKVDGSANVWSLLLPDTVPFGVSLIIDGAFNSLLATGGSGTTSIVASIDIFIELGSSTANSFVLRDVHCNRRDISALTYGSTFLDTTLNPFKATHLLLATDDSMVLSNTTFTNIKVLVHGNIFFEGSFATLQDQTAREFKVAPNTGLACLRLPNLTIAPDSIEIQFTGASGTDKTLSYCLISHAIVSK